MTAKQQYMSKARYIAGQNTKLSMSGTKTTEGRKYNTRNIKMCLPFS